MENEHLNEMSNTTYNFKNFYKKHKSKIILTAMLIAAILAANITSSFVFINSVVEGNSMLNTLEDGQKGISDGLFFRVGSIKRFDIVVIDQNETLMVKRVVGLPGEKIYFDGQGNLYINDSLVEQEFAVKDVESTGTLTRILGQNEYYVLGDNRSGSLDSRGFGPVSYSQIKSRGLLIFSSCEEVTTSGRCRGMSFNFPYFAK